MALFLASQLASMTLSELERYHNADSDNLNVCNAYIAKLTFALEDANAIISEQQEEINRLVNDNFKGG